MKAGILAVGLAMALAICFAGVELHLAAPMQQFEVEWSGDLVVWNWFGSWITTNRAAPLGGITIDDVSEQPFRFWRVVGIRSSNVWTTGGAIP